VNRDFRARRSIANLLLFALGLWIALSVFWSSDKYASAVLALHWISGLAILWAVSQLERDWLMLRVVAGVCFGLLLVYVAYGLQYRFVDVPELQKNWEQNRDQILRDRGWEPDSFMAIQFGKKIMSGEMIAFSASPNTFATM